MAGRAAQPQVPTERTARRGRPLNASVESAILRATVELLGERGFDRFTVQDIADRAGAGLGAIYRRWPTKLDVVVAAIRTLQNHAQPSVTGDVERDLAEAIECRVRDFQGCLGAVIPGLLSAMREHPDLAALLRDTSIDPGLTTIRAALATAFPDPTELELRTELTKSLLLYRLLVAQDLPKRSEIRSHLVPVILGRSIDEAKASRKRTSTRNKNTPR